MSNQIKDGGSAFPVLRTLESDMRGAACNTTFEATSTKGMSLRDWFAGMALQGILANNSRLSIPSSVAADWAYDLANNMLAVREKGASK